MNNELEALAAWNVETTDLSGRDMSALGAIRALQDLGLRVPQDVSVIGFDDIKIAAFNNPRLTTIRQPLSNMGRIAAQCILNRLNGSESFRKEIMVEPELLVRESTSMFEPASQTVSRNKNHVSQPAPSPG